MTKTTIAIIAAGLLGCAGSSTQANTNSTAPEPVPDGGADDDSRAAKNIERVEAMFTAWNANDADALLAQYTPEALSIGLGQATPSPPEKVADDREWLEKIWKIYPNGREEAVLIVANGERSAHLWRVETGAGHSFMGATLFAHESDGRIRERRGVADSLTLFHQWGVLKSQEAPDSEAAWETPVRAVTTGSATEAANIELLRKFSSAWSQNDGDAIATMLAPGYQHRVLANKEALDGAALSAWLSGRKGQTRADFEELSMFAAGDWVVHEVRLTMNFLSGAQAGKKASFTGVLFAEVKGGKVVRTIGVLNSAQGLIALGLMTAEQFDAHEAEFLKKLEAGASR